MTLIIRDISTGNKDLNRVQFYREWFAAVCHICDHLLSMPEMEKWMHLEPPIFTDGNMYNRMHRVRIARKAFETEGETFQPLYDGYFEHVAAEILEALKFGWFEKTAANGYIMMGTTGIIVVINKENDKDIVLTAFFGSTKSPRLSFVERKFAQSVRTLEQRLETPLPRDPEPIANVQRVDSLPGDKFQRKNRWKSMRKKRKKKHLEPKKIKDLQEVIHENLFKESLMFVRKHRMDTVSKYGRAVGATSHTKKPFPSDYWRLKQCIPQELKKNFKEWLMLRKERDTALEQDYGKEKPSRQSETPNGLG